MNLSIKWPKIMKIAEPTLEKENIDIQFTKKKQKKVSSF